MTVVKPWDGRKGWLADDIEKAKRRQVGPVYTEADLAAAVQAEREKALEEERGRVAVALAARDGDYSREGVAYLIEGFVAARKMAKRIRKHRRIITRLLAMRHVSKSALAAAEARAEARGMQATRDMEQIALTLLRENERLRRAIGLNADWSHVPANLLRKYAAAIRALTPSAAGEGPS